MKTTFDLSDPLLDEARRCALREGITLKALVERGLRRILAEQGVAAGFKLRDASVDGQGPQPGVAHRSWAELRDLVYEGRGG